MLRDAISTPPLANIIEINIDLICLKSIRDSFLCNRHSRYTAPQLGKIHLIETSLSHLKYFMAVLKSTTKILKSFSFLAQTDYESSPLKEFFGRS